MVKFKMEIWIELVVAMTLICCIKVCKLLFFNSSLLVVLKQTDDRVRYPTRFWVDVEKKCSSWSSTFLYFQGILCLMVEHCEYLVYFI